MECRLIVNMRNKIFGFLSLLSLLASLTSCTANGTEKYSGETAYDHYDFAIGVGEKIFLSFSGWTSVDDFKGLDAKVDDDFSGFSFKAAKGNDGGSLLFSFSKIRDCQITCIGEFAKAIDITELTFTKGDIEICFPVDVLINFNPDYLTSPSFPLSYVSAQDLYGNGMDGSHAHPAGNNTIYFCFAPYSCGYSDTESIFLETISPLTSDNLDLRSTEFAYIPDGLEEGAYYTLSFNPLQTPLNIHDGVFNGGVFLKFTFSEKKQGSCFGTDLRFDVRINGDSHAVFREFVIC